MKRIERYALNLQDWLFNEYAVLVSVIEIEAAMRTQYEDPLEVAYEITDAGRELLKAGVK